jgi:putative oxidoreductase
MFDMIVATLTSAISTLPKGLLPLSWLDDLRYLPEVRKSCTCSSLFG